MKELIEEIMNHCDGIIERSERMTSGNYMHNCAANKFSAKIIKSCVNNLVSGIHWQTGEPKEGGSYLISTLNDKVCYDYWRVFPNSSYWEYRSKFDVKAWCKLKPMGLLGYLAWNLSNQGPFMVVSPPYQPK